MFGLNLFCNCLLYKGFLVDTATPSYFCPSSRHTQYPSFQTKIYKYTNIITNLQYKHNINLSKSEQNVSCDCNNSHTITHLTRKKTFTNRRQDILRNRVKTTFFREYVEDKATRSHNSQFTPKTVNQI